MLRIRSVIVFGGLLNFCTISFGKDATKVKCRFAAVDVEMKKLFESDVIVHEIRRTDKLVSISPNKIIRLDGPSQSEQYGYSLYQMFSKEAGKGKFNIKVFDFRYSRTSELDLDPIVSDELIVGKKIKLKSGASGSPTLECIVE